MLKTIDGYRIGYLDNLNTIYKSFDVDTMKYHLAPTVVFQGFGASKVFDTKEQALTEAIQLCSKLNAELDDGVGYVIDDGENKSFAELIHGKY